MDDSLIFMSANTQSAHRLNDIWRIYRECSGQCVNREKSSIFFNPNTHDTTRANFNFLMGIEVETFSERYLNLPTAVGHVTSGTFDHIGERVRVYSVKSAYRTLMTQKELLSLEEGTCTETSENN